MKNIEVIVSEGFNPQKGKDGKTYFEFNIKEFVSNREIKNKNYTSTHQNREIAIITAENIALSTFNSINENEKQISQDEYSDMYIDEDGNDINR